MFHLRAFAILAVSFLVVAGRAQAADPKDELIGKWTVVSGEQAGNKLPEEALKQVNLRIEFTKDKLIVKLQGKDDDEATYTLDTAKSPMWIDTVNKKKEHEKGIFKMDKDMLTICVAADGADRPSEFGTKVGSKLTMLVLKKDK